MKNAFLPLNTVQHYLLFSLCDAIVYQSYMKSAWVEKYAVFLYCNLMFLPNQQTIHFFRVNCLVQHTDENSCTPYPSQEVWVPASFHQSSQRWKGAHGASRTWVYDIHWGLPPDFALTQPQLLQIFGKWKSFVSLSLCFSNTVKINKQKY